MFHVMNSSFFKYLLIYIMCIGFFVGCNNETEIVSEAVPVLEDF